MNLEGRKFHFARDDDGHIYAENEIETETANRDGWLLPPRKGERYIVRCLVGSNEKEIEVAFETTGELKNNYPVCEFIEIISVETGLWFSMYDRSGGITPIYPEA